MRTNWNFVLIVIFQILGMWYGSEVIDHNEVGSDGEINFDTCVVVHIAETTSEVSNRII